MPAVQGHCDEGFSAVKSLFQKHIDTNAELGASIYVNLDGKDVVDIWSGYAALDRSRQWESDTIVNTFSTTKTVTALAILLLIDKGLLSLEDKIAKHWPEFAANGKQDIEIRHILSHSSGLPGFDEQVSLDGICDAPKTAALLAKQAPWWEPGTKSGYHSLTYGYILGEVVRRVTGKSLKQFIAEDIAAPLDADFQLGCSDEDEKRRSNVIPPPPRDPPPNGVDLSSVLMRVMMNPRMSANFTNGELFRKAEIGAGNGHSNAHGVGRIMRALACNGQVDGKQFISPATTDLLFQEQISGVDLVLDTGGKSMRWGLGFGLTGIDTYIDFLPEGRVCTWGGFGGSMVVVDADRRMTFVYIMNRMRGGMLGGGRDREYVRAVYQALGVE